MTKRLIPSFYLYGEPHRAVNEDFVHVEAIDDRSRPRDWTITPHSHSELSHLFALVSGGGTMIADGRKLPCAAPCIMLVPAATVHGFDWSEGTDGFVITIAAGYVLELVRQDEELATLFESPGAVGLDEDNAVRTGQLISDLMRELSWSAPGHRAAVNAIMLSLLTTALRRQSAAARTLPRIAPHASTVARFRERIEKRFRMRESMTDHAAALGVSQTALRVACARIAGRSPAQMLDQRALLEARRALLYSNLSVAEIAFSIGFQDPAYFSRFFQRGMQMSPRHYRATHRLPRPGPAENEPTRGGGQ